MGELSRADACAKREKYKQVFTEIMEMAEKEFSDMDFENADKRTEVEMHIMAIKIQCGKKIKELDGLSFE